MYEQIIVLIVILLTLFLFVQNKIRYDFVAVMAVLVLVITQVINPEEAFQGLSHPAVLTVASVLIISNALIKTNAIDKVVSLINKGSNKIQLIILSLMAITAVLSAFMNNIGALAIIVPVTLKIAKDNDIMPSKLLMPVAFASLLGGMITTIGTPPNLIVSGFRYEEIGESFSFFAFAPTGIVLTLIGILFTSFIGYKLIPKRASSSLVDRYNLEDFLFELVATDECSVDGIKLRDFNSIYGVSINIVSIVRSNRQITAPRANHLILPNDILIVKAGPNNLNEILQKTCLKLKGAKKDKLSSEKILRSNDVALIEVVIRNDSNLIGRTAVETKLRNRYNANLIAVSTKGIYKVNRLKTYRFKRGDILLLQAPRHNLSEMFSKMRVLPLAEKEIDLKIEDSNKKQITTIIIFAISIILAALNIIPIHIAFISSAILLVLFKVITPREFYDSIEWPTIILIGSLFALGLALESSGASKSVANIITSMSNYLPNSVILGVVMVLTIILTNIINNTASSVLMAPIAISIANTLGVSIDPFLMAVVVGASTSFLTPIAHQSNMLVMGPGGYKFTDYWKLGLPLAIFSIVIGIPLIMYIWPM